MHPLASGPCFSVCPGAATKGDKCIRGSGERGRWPTVRPSVLAPACSLCSIAGTEHFRTKFVSCQMRARKPANHLQEQWVMWCITDTTDDSKWIQMIGCGFKTITFMLFSFFLDDGWFQLESYIHIPGIWSHYTTITVTFHENMLVPSLWRPDLHPWLLRTTPNTLEFWWCQTTCRTKHNPTLTGRKSCSPVSWEKRTSTCRIRVFTNIVYSAYCM